MKKRILIIEDDPDLFHLLDMSLKEEYAIFYAEHGWAGMDLWEEADPDLVLLDLLLPGIDGWEVCRRIRHRSNVPIIVLTGLGHEQHIIRALDLGADDYVTKPFRVGELKARIRAALRRGEGLPSPGMAIEIDSRLKLDRGTHSLVVDENAVELSVIEYDLLTLLIENAGRILTHDVLLSRVWGWDQMGQTNYLKVYIHRLRQKIEKDPSEPCYILTERRLGYRFQIPPQ